MKKLTLVLVTILFAVTGILAQTPHLFKYQAVLRDESGAIMASEAVTVDISILKGSAGGTSVFDETHNVTTTAQGLINLNIGSVEDLSVVDFSNDTYFIEITVDGTVMGTSQLLSVPYALQAKTAETADYNSLTNLPTLFDGKWTSLTNTPTTITGYGITDAFDGDYNSLSNLPTLFDGSYNSLTDLPTLFSGDYNDLTNKPTIDGSETVINAGTNVTVSGNGTTANPYIVSASGSASTYSVGDFAQGGIVFWVDETEQHGLVCAKTDQGTDLTWYAGTNGVTRATGDGPFSGELNTAIIISSQVSIGDNGNDYAAQVCNDLKVTEGGKTYGDWYLPSKEELNLMYQNKAIIDATATANGGSSFESLYYWSSTEISDSKAWIQTFSSGIQKNGNKSFSSSKVRAIRAF